MAGGIGGLPSSGPGDALPAAASDPGRCRGGRPSDRAIDDRAGDPRAPGRGTTARATRPAWRRRARPRPSSSPSSGGPGTRGRSAVDLAADVLAGYDGLTGLARATDLELAGLAGIGEARAAQLVAAFELGSADCSRTGRPAAGRSAGPRDVADRLILQMGRLEREELRVVLLDTKNHVLRVATVYQGNVSASLVRVGELFRDAVRLNAAAIILVHNHPSGDPTPSPDDLHLTAETLAAGRLLDIQLLDHLVIGHDAYVSLRDRGVAFDRPVAVTARAAPCTRGTPDLGPRR